MGFWGEFRRSKIVWRFDFTHRQSASGLTTALIGCVSSPITTLRYLDLYFAELIFLHSSHLVVVRWLSKIYTTSQALRLRQQLAAGQYVADQIVGKIIEYRAVNRGHPISPRLVSQIDWLIPMREPVISRGFRVRKIPSQRL